MRSEADRRADADLIAEWDTWMSLSGNATLTRTTRARCLRAFAAQHGPLLAAGHVDIAQWLGRVQHVGTRSSYASYLRCFYSWAVAEGHVDVDPTGRLPKMKARRAAPRPIPVAELSAALGAAPTRERLWLELMAYAGLRCCEVAAHRRANLWQDGEGTWWLRVPHSKGGHDQQVPVPAWLGEKASRADDSSVSAQWVQKRCRAVLRAAGSRSTPHALRHYYATSVLAATQNLRLTQVLMRHADPSTTARYAAVAARDTVAAVQNLPRVDALRPLVVAS